MRWIKSHIIAWVVALIHSKGYTIVKITTIAGTAYIINADDGSYQRIGRKEKVR
jgi:hypothetical protein